MGHLRVIALEEDLAALQISEGNTTLATEPDSATVVDGASFDDEVDDVIIEVDFEEAMGDLGVDALSDDDGVDGKAHGDVLQIDVVVISICIDHVASDGEAAALEQDLGIAAESWNAENRSLVDGLVAEHGLHFGGGRETGGASLEGEAGDAEAISEKTDLPRRSTAADVSRCPLPSINPSFSCFDC